MSKLKETTLTTRELGDAFHLFNLFGIVTFGASLIRWRDEYEMFDQAWLKEGFCLPHSTIPYWTTHDVSGYVMLFISFLGLGILHWLRDTTFRRQQGDKKYSKDQGLELARTLTFWALIGAIGHGMGHFLISYGKRQGIFPEGSMRGMDMLKEESIWRFILQVAQGYVLFWIPLVKTYMINVSRNKLAVIALLVQLGALQVPSRFGFAYTQMVLFAGLSLDQLLYVPVNQKGFEYALWPIMTVLPSTAFSWLESTSCTTSLLMRDFGHVIYDCFMSSSFILYFLVCWIRFNSSKHQHHDKLK